jgi:hypothetical protein
VRRPRHIEAAERRTDLAEWGKGKPAVRQGGRAEVAAKTKVVVAAAVQNFGVLCTSARYESIPSSLETGIFVG